MLSANRIDKLTVSVCGLAVPADIHIEVFRTKMMHLSGIFFLSVS